MRRRELLGGCREQVERIAADVGAEPHREVDLVDVAGGDVVPRACHPGGVPVGRRQRRADRPDRERARGRRGLREPLAQQREALLQRHRPGLAPKRFEVPAPVGLAAQDVVVEGERERRQPGVLGRWRRQRLDQRAEPVAEPAEPAAAERPVVAAGDDRLVVEQREGVTLAVRDDQRLGAEHGAAAGPIAHEGERPRVVAQQARDVERRPARVELDPHAAGCGDRCHGTDRRTRGRRATRAGRRRSRAARACRPRSCARPRAPRRRSAACDRRPLRAGPR